MTARLDRIRRAAARILRPRELREGRAVATLSICFDDFPRTAWTVGGRVLQDLDVLATYYLCGRLCGSTFDGQEMFGSADLDAIHGAGHELGCHTFEHVSCLRSGTSELRASLDANQRFVRERLGDVRLVSFAYPYGDATYGAKRLLVERFASARGIRAGVNVGSLDLGHLRAVGLESSKLQVGAVEPYVAEAARNGGWLVVFSHDVQERPSPFGCHPDELVRLVKTARSAGLEILPVKAALAARAFATPLESAAAH